MSLHQATSSRMHIIWPGGGEIITCPPGPCKSGAELLGLGGGGRGYNSVVHIPDSKIGIESMIIRSGAESKSESAFLS